MADIINQPAPLADIYVTPNSVDNTVELRYRGESVLVDFNSIPDLIASLYKIIPG